MMRGLVHAKLPAVMAKPASMVDQMAISTVASMIGLSKGCMKPESRSPLQRKSGSRKVSTYASLTTTAPLATQPMVNSGIVATFNLTGMLSFLMIAIGNKANVKSQSMVSDEYRYVSAIIMSIEMHVPLVSSLFQKYEMGRHWNVVTKKKARPVRLLSIMMV